MKRHHSHFKRITVDPDQCFGKPCIRGLRMPVAPIPNDLSSSMTVDEIPVECERAAPSAIRGLFIFIILFQTLLASPDEPLWTYRMEPLYVDYRKPPGYVGKLAYDSAVILPYVSEIHTYLGAFKYRYRIFGAEFPYDWMNPVSTGGWMGAGDHFGVQVLDGALSDEEFDRGWYAAAPKTRKSQTPNGWIYAVDIQRWVDPLKFNSLMQEWLNVNGFRYEIIMTPDREFAFEGRLSYEGVERIPDWEYIYYKNPLTVTTDIGTFFYIGSRMEESKWWVRKIHLDSEKSTGRTTPDASMKDRGWFEGDYPETTFEIPEGWVYWIEQKVWFDIQRIEEIVRSFSMNVDGWSIVR